MINTEELLEIIDDLKHVAPHMNYEIIFEQACSYQRGRIANSNKKLFKEDKPVTEKQKQHLEKNKKKLLSMGIMLNKITTSKQASKILNELWKGEKK